MMETFDNTGEMKLCELEERKKEVDAMISRGEKIMVAHREIDTYGCKCEISPYYTIDEQWYNEKHGSDGMVRFVLSRPIVAEPDFSDANGIAPPPSRPLRYPPDNQDFEMKHEDFTNAVERIRKHYKKFLHVLGIRKGEGRWLALGFYASQRSPLEEQKS